MTPFLSGPLSIEALMQFKALEPLDDSARETLHRIQSRDVSTFNETLPIRLTPMTATCRVPPLSRVKLGIGWARGAARDAEQ